MHAGGTGTDGAVPEQAVPMDVRRLLDARAYPHPVSSIRLVETHISWVLLSGAYAYKIKKPVSLGFLDFSTLPLRHRACLDELRLNRRLAPAIYLDVVPISGPADAPTICGTGPAIEYAVRMREFPQQAQLDRLLAAGQLQAGDIDALAAVIAAFHTSAPVAPAAMRYGWPAQIRQPVADNFAALLAGTEGATQQAIEALAAWTRLRNIALEPAMNQRRRQGCVREVHGDLHLANLVRLETGIVPFDCVEFSEELRWLDVINDLAFATMDLCFRGRSDFAYRLLNRYLEATGDYAGVPLLHYYEVYRALVRAKIAMIRREETTGIERSQQQHSLDAYVDLAQRRSTADGIGMILMHGYSGAGKTWLSDRLMTALPAVRLRSDVERKRLHGLHARTATGSQLLAGIYSSASSEQLYAHLADAVGAILAGGESVIVDAACLRRADRARFQQLAQKLGVPLAIVSCVAPVSELQRRIEQRAQHGADASEADRAVLDYQLANAEPLDQEEQRRTLMVTTADIADARGIAARLRALLQTAMSPQPAKSLQ